jgi:acetyltransferase-like isoleucine patch superfamily enzyme
MPPLTKLGHRGVQRLTRLYSVRDNVISLAQDVHIGIGTPICAPDFPRELLTTYASVSAARSRSVTDRIGRGSLLGNNVGLRWPPRPRPVSYGGPNTRHARVDWRLRRGARIRERHSVVIGEDCWIGYGAPSLSQACKIGAGARSWALELSVTSDVTPMDIVAHVPAREVESPLSRCKAVHRAPAAELRSRPIRGRRSGDRTASKFRPRRATATVTVVYKMAAPLPRGVLRAASRSTRDLTMFDLRLIVGQADKELAEAS